MNENAQSPSTVNMVIGYLGAIGMVGLIGVIFLTYQKVDPAAVAVVVALVGPPIGALGAVLAQTRTVNPQVSEAVGYRAAVADVQSLDPSAGPVVEAPAMVVPPADGGDGI